jgi:ABC-2 type transport system permease protein
MSALPTITRRTASAEWRRLWSVRSTWTLAVVTTIGLLAITVLAASQSAATAPTGGSPWQLAGMLSLPALFGILVLVSVATTADHATGNIVPTLQWTPRRGVLLAARVAVITVTATSLGVGLLIAASTTIWFFAPQLAYVSSSAAEKIGGVTLVYVTTALLAVGLGLALRSTAGALASVFALVLVLPLFLQLLPFTWVTRLIEALPGSGALFFLLGEGPGDTVMTAGGAALVLTAWAAAALALGSWRLLRSDADR